MSTGMMTWVSTDGRTATPRVTIADVAREAGVNKGTVSRALRGSSRVGKSTRERIVETADRLDYSASPIATALATGSSRTVGIVLPTLRSWYFSEVASGACDVLAPAGYRVELISLGVGGHYIDVDSPQFHELFSELGGGGGRDALLFASTVSTEQPGSGTGVARVPAALVGRSVTSVPGVYIDHREGGRLVAEHLLALGHRRLAIVDGRPPEAFGPTIWDQRSEGFLQVLGEAGLDVEDELHLRPGDCQAEHGARAIDSLLRSGTPLPSAIFCHSDPLAFGVLSALRRNRIHCPQDVSVAAFDDHPMSRFWGLTTVSQHAYDQGVRAAQALIGTIETGVEPALSARCPGNDDVRVELVVRESTGPL